jgi:hypothetical protein
MQPVSCFNQNALQVATHPVSILRYRGNFNGNVANRWLMLFNSVVAPANNTVPLVPAIPLNMEAPFFSEFEIGALEFSLGCYVAVSSTQETLTLSADTMDFSAELSDPEMPNGTTLVGDLTTGVVGLQVWSEANGNPAGVGARKLLLAVEVDGTNITGPSYIQIHAKDAPQIGDVPLFCYPIAAGQKRTGSNGLRFGEKGIDVFSNDNTTTPRYGCTVKVCGTPTYSALNLGTCCIRAEFK